MPRETLDYKGKYLFLKTKPNVHVCLIPRPFAPLRIEECERDFSELYANNID